MKRLAVLILGLSLAGCATAPKLACPSGQTAIQTAQLFLGAKPPARLADKDLRAFVDQEIAPRFPDGVTVVDGGGQWKGPDDRMMRDAAKVVLVVLPARGNPHVPVEAVRTAYRDRFKQETVVVTPPPACVAL